MIPNDHQPDQDRVAALGHGHGHKAKVARDASQVECLGGEDEGGEKNLETSEGDERAGPTRLPWSSVGIVDLFALNEYGLGETVDHNGDRAEVIEETEPKEESAKLGTLLEHIERLLPRLRWGIPCLICEGPSTVEHESSRLYL